MKNFLTVLSLICTFASIPSFAAPNSKWVKLEDLEKVSYSDVWKFQVIYDGEVLFSQKEGRTFLGEQFRAIVIQAKNDHKALYFALPTPEQYRNGIISLSEILVPEDGFFVRKK